MTGLTGVPGAFGYGDSILVGERVRLRGVRDDDLPALAGWEMDPGRLITVSNWVAPPSDAAAKERGGKAARLQRPAASGQHCVSSGPQRAASTVSG